VEVSKCKIDGGTPKTIGSDSIDAPLSVAGKNKTVAIHCTQCGTMTGFKENVGLAIKDWETMHGS